MATGIRARLMKLYRRLLLREARIEQSRDELGTDAIISNFGESWYYHGGQPKKAQEVSRLDLTLEVHMRARKTLLSSVVISAAAVLLSPITALAASYTDSVGGIEVFATSTTGVFSGTAGGSLPGVWAATVNHTPLGTSATITSGSFDVVSALGGLPAVVAGSFSGGSVVQTSGFHGCVNQTFNVNGSLVSVGVVVGRIPVRAPLRPS